MSTVPATYRDQLSEIKGSIHRSALKPFLATNAEIIQLYWTIGFKILEQQKAAGRGAKVIEHLADDLRKEFPGMSGLSVRNLKYMRQFSSAYPDIKLVKSALTQITWYHHTTLLSKVSDPGQRMFYIKQSSVHRWSRGAMLAQIKATERRAAQS